MNTTVKYANGKEIGLIDPKVYIVRGESGIGKSTLLGAIQDDNIQVWDYSSITSMLIIKILYEGITIIFETNTEEETTRLINMLSVYDIVPVMIEFKRWENDNGKHE